MKSRDEAPIGRDLYVVNTGEWRFQRPVVSKEKCTGCGVCLVFCPTSSIRQGTDGLEVSLESCKGCGICAHECHVQAIAMEIEERP